MNVAALGSELAGLVGAPSAPVGLSDELLAPLLAELADPFAFFARSSEPVRALGGTVPGEEQVSIRPGSAQRWFDRGNTLYLMRADLRHPLLRTYLGALRELVPHDFGSVGVFVSPAGAVSEWHFDQYDNINVQLAGAKRWELASTPAFADPRGNYGLGEAVPASLAYCRGELEAIDTIVPEAHHLLPARSAIFVPAGVWHRVTSEESPSISLTFTFRRRARLDALLVALEARLVKDAWWRRPNDESVEALVERLLRIVPHP